MSCQTVFAFLLINLIITPVKYYHSSACGRAEYETNGQCCPMCSPGTRVYKDCTDYTSTSCVPCTEATFTDKPNGLITCFPCTVCDKGFGLKTVKECTASSDTVCGVLEGNYCVDPYEGGCRKAEKHTTCKPGQFIRLPGTGSADTECENCPENSYSNGSSTSCTPHTDCESRKLTTIRQGDSVSDSECGSSSHMKESSRHNQEKLTPFSHNHEPQGRNNRTEYTDTVCESCPENSFSKGSSTSCTPHTDCKSKGLLTTKPGDTVSD
ncbi:tumor necrosis factor receptor superfamily member 5-like isoform X1 [Arapaima gigas]